MCFLSERKSAKPKKNEKQSFFQFISRFSIKAEAPPPPLQMAAAPKVLFFTVKALIKVTTIRAPEQPKG